MKLQFVLEKETKGALRYKEVDSNGEDVNDYKVGTLYLRKSAFVGSKHPLAFICTLEWDNG